MTTVKILDGKKARELAEKKYNEMYKGLQEVLAKLINDTWERADFEFILPTELKNPKFFDKIKKLLEERFFTLEPIQEDDDPEKSIIKVHFPEKDEPKS